MYKSDISSNASYVCVLIYRFLWNRYKLEEQEADIENLEQKLEKIFKAAQQSCDSGRIFIVNQRWVILSNVCYQLAIRDIKIKEATSKLPLWSIKELRRIISQEKTLWIIKHINTIYYNWMLMFSLLIIKEILHHFDWPLVPFDLVFFNFAFIIWIIFFILLRGYWVDCISTHTMSFNNEQVVIEYSWRTCWSLLLFLPRFMCKNIIL